MTPSYHVYISDKGNLYMTEIASLIAATLSDIGYHTVFPAPGLPEKAKDRINLVIAPHEFFSLQPERSERELLTAAEASVCVTTEQPGTSWFEMGAHYASRGPMVLDINPYAAHAMAERGVETRLLRVGYHPSWDRWGGDPEKPRLTDVLFLGSLTDYRHEVLALASSFLWDSKADIRLFEATWPMSEARDHFVVDNQKWDLLSTSRVLLNVHRGENPYFEWVRVLQAVSNGCMIVTELSSDYGPLLPGEHLIAAPIDSLGPYCLNMMTDETLRVEMASAAYELVRNKYAFTTLLEPICAELDELIRTPGGRSSSFVKWDPPQVREPDPILEAVLDIERKAGVRVKEVMDAETELIRQVETLQAKVLHGDREHVEVSATPAWKGFEPDVSVVISLYNYEAVIAEAMESVMSSLGVAAELIVVDDHSWDGSRAVVKGLMSKTSWFPTSLVAKAANGGLGAARNAGIAEARSDRVFILDADNLVFPRTLQQLSAALDRAPDAAFAYGTIVKFGQHSGLVSYLPWDVVRLANDNYIDAMAMVRRQVFEDHGGYETLKELWGWEDYELWLRLAAAGLRGEFVHTFVGRYRSHPTSLIHTAGLDTVQMWQTLHERYPFLPWRDL